MFLGQKRSRTFAHIFIYLLFLLRQRLNFFSANCTFATGLCGWKNDVSHSSDQFQWTRSRGSTPSTLTGPPGDRKGRKYISENKFNAKEVEISAFLSNTIIHDLFIILYVRKVIENDLVVSLFVSLFLCFISIPSVFPAPILKHY